MEVRPVTYKGVKQGRYFISDTGHLYRLECGKITELHGCNPDNEKGYIRASLATSTGGVKKFSIHRLVMHEFIGPSDLEVNHIDGIKHNNNLSNLEYVTGDENKHHAAINGLYKTCENHPHSVLTNEQVHQICRLLEKGYNARKVIKKLNLPYSSAMENRIVKLSKGIGWDMIRTQYKIDHDDVRLKVYKHKDLVAFAILLNTHAYTCREIAKKFKKYNEKRTIQVLKKMKQGKLYKSIMDEVRSSTTITNSDHIRDDDGFIILRRKSC